MSEISKEILRNYINEQKFTSSNDVLTAMKGMFRDVLQEALAIISSAALSFFSFI